jgi:hypothetical protein
MSKENLSVKGLAFSFTRETPKGLIEFIRTSKHWLTILHT